MDNSINSKFQRNTNLPPAQRGVVSQAAAANRYSQEAIREGDNRRTQAHLQKLFENNNVPRVRAKLLAERWRGAVEVKFASEQALGRRGLTDAEIAAHEDHLAVADLAIFQVQNMARQNYRSTASLTEQAANLPPPPPDNT